MDFGAFILFGLVALAALVFAPWVVVGFVKRQPGRFGRLGCLGVMAGFLAVLGLFIYKVYVLDEGLAIAAKHGRTTEALTFLSRGADPNAPLEGGATALLGAAAHGDVRLTKALLARGADPNLGSDDRYSSPLECARRNGNKEVAHLLRAAGAVE